MEKAFGPTVDYFECELAGLATQLECLASKDKKKAMKILDFYIGATANVAKHLYDQLPAAQRSAAKMILAGGGGSKGTVSLFTKGEREKAIAKAQQGNTSALQVTTLKKAANAALAKGDNVRAVALLQQIAKVTELQRQREEMGHMSSLWAPVAGVPFGGLFGYIVYQVLKAPATVAGGVVGVAGAAAQNAGISLWNGMKSANAWLWGSNATATGHVSYTEAAAATAEGVDALINAVTPQALKIAYIIFFMILFSAISYYLIDLKNRLTRKERRELFAGPANIPAGLLNAGKTRRRSRSRGRKPASPASRASSRASSKSSKASRSRSRSRSRSASRSPTPQRSTQDLADLQFLGLGAKATDAEIRARIVKLKKDWHPDRHVGNTSGTNWTKKFQDLGQVEDRLL